MVLAVQNLRVQYGARVLFNDLSFTVEDGERIALAGHNGAGKSTLMKCIAGLNEPDSGSIIKSRHSQAGYLPQEGIHVRGRRLIDEAMSAFADLMGLQERIDALTQEMEKLDPRSAAYSEVLNEIGELELVLHAHDSARLRPRTESILRGLGFKDRDFDRDCGEFSGGWQMRIALAKLLLREPEVLLLDEPTNHLDIQSQRWMEQYLRTYRGAIILISHDVALLDSLVSRTIAFYHGRAEEYAGNFSYFLKESVLRKEILLRQKKAQEREIAKTKEFIDRFRYKATKASLVQSRIKQLEKVELIEVEEDDAVMNFHFPTPPAGAHSVVRLEKVSKRYGPISVFEDVDFEIVKGDRIAIVGVNGAGKSTFSRLISGGEEPSSGSVTMGRHTQTAFFSQTHADDLDPEKTVLECVEAAATRESAPMVRNLLGCFLFRGDDVHKRVGVLSGGERSRVALVCMLLHPANFLILDEPTNHLDIQSQQVLQQALSEYPGSYCIVSHNRSFLDPIVTKVLEFVPGEKPRVYMGNVSDYLEKVERDQALASAAASSASGAADPGTGADRKARRRMEAEIRQKKTRVLRPLQEQLEQLEAEIARLETEKTEITSRLELPEVAADTDAVMELTTRFQQADRQLETCFTQWAALSEKIEETEARIEAEASRNVSGS
ncbi:ABC-F family ATP-binding cassette domain-containing protein [Akkermansia sp.]|uniref:ABC-F family ATP-binding cassette domain-containing protein n=1 Tax=Akkermansia sp. TaxID=1872421 RepID=UPI0025C32709|nr:ABC-F family ATP-binding cassette domain-containing protein [Akkermansia sp.]MCD8063885.1 ABC-F family ATP-binding cassette domain-containing protein [Akkermansia sp.]